MGNRGAIYAKGKHNTAQVAERHRAGPRAAALGGWSVPVRLTVVGAGNHRWIANPTSITVVTTKGPIGREKA